MEKTSNSVRSKRLQYSKRGIMSYFTKKCVYNMRRIKVL